LLLELKAQTLAHHWVDVLRSHLRAEQQSVPPFCVGMDGTRARLYVQQPYVQKLLQPPRPSQRKPVLAPPPSPPAPPPSPSLRLAPPPSPPPQSVPPYLRTPSASSSFPRPPSPPPPMSLTELGLGLPTAVRLPAAEPTVATERHALPSSRLKRSPDLMPHGPACGAPGSGRSPPRKPLVAKQARGLRHSTITGPLIRSPGGSDPGRRRYPGAWRRPGRGWGSGQEMRQDS
jgi:hypothetical protein